MTVPIHGMLSPATPLPWNNSNSSIDKEYAIKGQMITASYAISYTDVANMKVITDPNDIKEKLMYMLAQKMREEKLIEFTKQDLVGEGVYQFNARIYALPDTQVRILREKLV